MIARARRTVFSIVAPVVGAIIVVLCAGCDQSAGDSSGDGASAQIESHPEPAQPGNDDGAAAATINRGQSGNVDRPLIKFETLTYNFGKMSETEQRDGVLRFTNAGVKTLVIEDITTTCGCTTAKPDKMRYEPGESGTINVTFEPSGPNDPGKPQRKYVNIKSNGAAAANGVTSIAILADVEAFINIEPRMVKIGTIDLGRPYETDITVSSADPEFTIDRVTASNPHVSTQIIDVPSDNTELTKRIVRLRIDSNAPWGGFLSWLTINVSGKPKLDATRKSHEAKVRVQGQVFGELAAEPNVFRFGAQPGEVFERELLLTHRAGAPFAVVSATANASELNNIRVELQEVGIDTWMLTLHATAGPNTRQFDLTSTGTVQVTTTLGGAESLLEIPIVGRVRKPSR